MGFKELILSIFFCLDSNIHDDVIKYKRFPRY